ncbi:TrkH family potassium uptake protein [Roseibium sp. CAU 1637]|uniref:Trk system potassium uptake protein n=1 Tax=Roseibium limicola TaxID=2816037 RepID=A0A939ERG5_9HYPH|nr:TrkH family potassium uptake protein [Roseibium limicola]MBO0347143.1 TrkH family potassium uptake protein [Roseibium limicola]
MDYRAVALPIGRLLILISAFMILPASADLLANNPDWKAFLISAVIIGCFGSLATAAWNGSGLALRRRETFLFVNMAWIAFCTAGAIPLYTSGLNLSFTDAFFESVSGLTTTGSTILTHLDTMPPGILLWRSLLQWIGGIGIVVVGIWLLPGLRVGGSQLFAIESSENTAKPYGRIEPFMRRLLTLYATLTVTCILLYIACGMNLFQAINHAMTTVSTGGYSTSDSSFGQFSGNAVYWVSIVFMLGSSVPFLFLIRMIEGREGNDTYQVFWLLGIVAAASLVIFLSQRWVQHDNPMHLLTMAVFHVVSVITTTGYAATDYLLWGPFVICIFFLLTFIGGCSGSTSGGFKIFRIVLLLGFILALLRRMVFPHRVLTPRYANKPISPSVVEGVLVFGILYAGTFAVFAVIYGFFGLNLETALSASITALANVGPGVGDIIGPSGTFKPLPDPVKWLLSMQMILGRLEIIAGLILFSPDFWLDE